MLKKWLPWKFIIKRAASAYGFLDPITLMARLRRFGHPSEVQEPIELIRAGVVFHARGLVNTRAIQYNLDWVWPYWIVKQFKPNDISFIPRGFAFSHVNLTHRNWTAVGHPDLPYYPIVDPRGLVTPYLDGWSIDVWVVSNSNGTLYPCEAGSARQELVLEEDALRVVTRTQRAGLTLETRVWVAPGPEGMLTHLHATAFSELGGHLVVALRPYNPEGVQFIDAISFDRSRNRFRVDGQRGPRFDRPPEKVLFSNYARGDVAHHLDQPEHEPAVTCEIGMASAAALFSVPPDRAGSVSVTLPLMATSGDRRTSRRPVRPDGPVGSWRQRLAETARLIVPDEKFQFLYDAAIRTLLLLSADEAYPGPYTYKRFWFRDACLMINAMLGIGLVKRATRMIKLFPARQTLTGYFRSQEGEWDSNGQVLWIAGRLHELTGIVYDDDLMISIFNGADWIIEKRRQTDPRKPHGGLLPAGFSAEHLGPNDYYYWDDFWAVAGLYAAARLAGTFRRPGKHYEYQRQADLFLHRILDSIAGIPQKRRNGAIPASPYRRMDAGAVGSMVADYPLQLTPPNDPLIMRTADFLMAHCFRSGAFFQDMIHSGLNAYLTLAMAQTLLRAGNPAFRQLIRATADLASPTGQWPEAVHPFTRGGCMGDGQHGWAAAEWLMMMRSLFVREEGRTLVIGSGIFPEWLENGARLSFGPTPVPGGQATVHLHPSAGTVLLDLDLGRRTGPVDVQVAVPGFRTQHLDTSCRELKLEPI